MSTTNAADLKAELRLPTRRSNYRGVFLFQAALHIHLRVSCLLTSRPPSACTWRAFLHTQQQTTTSPHHTFPTVFSNRYVSRSCVTLSPHPSSPTSGLVPPYPCASLPAAALPLVQSSACVSATWISDSTHHQVARLPPRTAS